MRETISNQSMTIRLQVNEPIEGHTIFETIQCRYTLSEKNRELLFDKIIRCVNGLYDDAVKSETIELGIAIEKED